MVANPLLKVLVVDDEVDLEMLFRQRFRRKIAKAEIELVFARDGEDAVTTLQTHQDIHIVFTDINMPKVGGFQLLQEAKSLGRILEVVIMSAYADMTNIRSAMNRGAFDFLVKPLDFSDLEATLEKTRQQVRRQVDAALASLRAQELFVHNEFIRQTFGRYVSEDVVAELLDRPGGLQLGGVRRPLTVFFSDLRGFTAIAEKMAPEDVVYLLNAYFDAVFPIILGLEGTIQAITGDGLFVIFGAPVHRDDAAERACACALRMQGALEELRKRADFPTKDLAMGIGIHSGYAVVGNIGSKDRRHYSAVGRDVNLAARVEASTMGGQTLITDQTLAELRCEVEIRSSFEIMPKGVATPLRLHEVVAIGGSHAFRWEAETDAVTPLAEPLLIQFWIMDGKSSRSPLASGRILALSRHRALFSCESLPEPMTDLRLVFPTEGSSEEDVYARVLPNGEGEGTVLLGLTYFPPRIARRWLPQQNKSL